MPDNTLKLANGHLILVEDDRDVRRSLTLMLRARGYTVDVYRSGDEIMSTRTLAPAHCLLLDYKLPGQDGITLFKRLRDAGVTAPALLITGVISRDLETMARQAGFAETLFKPVPMGALIESLKRLVPPAAA